MAGAYGYLGGLPLGKAKYSRADAAEGDGGGKAFAGCKAGGSSCSKSELGAMQVGRVAVGNGADRVDDALAGKVVGGRYLCHASRFLGALFFHEPSAFGPQLHARRGVTGIVDAVVSGTQQPSIWLLAAFTMASTASVVMSPRHKMCSSSGLGFAVSSVDISRLGNQALKRQLVLQGVRARWALPATAGACSPGNETSSTACWFRRRRLGAGARRTARPRVGEAGPLCVLCSRYGSISIASNRSASARSMSSSEGWNACGYRRACRIRPG